MRIPAYLFLLGATALFCFGSLIAMAAPGDGQTGMFVLPLWFFGGLAQILATCLVWLPGEARRFRKVTAALVLGCLAVSVGSVAGAWHASETLYPHPRTGTP